MKIVYTRPKTELIIMKSERMILSGSEEADQPSVPKGTDPENPVEAESKPFSPSILPDDSIASKSVWDD